MHAFGTRHQPVFFKFGFAIGGNGRTDRRKFGFTKIGSLFPVAWHLHTLYTIYIITHWKWCRKFKLKCDCNCVTVTVWLCSSTTINCAQPFKTMDLHICSLSLNVCICSISFCLFNHSSFHTHTHTLQKQFKHICHNL